MGPRAADADLMSLPAISSFGTPQLTLGRVRLWAVLGGTALLDLLGLWLAARRVMTGERAPLGASALIATAFALSAYVAALRMLWPGDQFLQVPIFPHRWTERLPAIGLVLVGVALMLPGTSAPAVIAFWATLLTVEICARQLQVSRVPTVSMAMRASSPLAAERSPAIREDTGPDVATELKEPTSDDLDVIQQLTRRQSDDGGAALEAWLRADFAPGQRMATVHIAFCPPFARRPEVYVEAVSGPDATPRVMQVLTTGARVDVRLPRPSPARSHVGIQLFAETPPVHT